MRIETTSRTLYDFDELSDEGKEKAREWWRQAENKCDFAEHVIDDAAEIAALLGIDLRKTPVKLGNGTVRYKPTIYWAGFSSQGDGACFEGLYSFRNKAAEAVGHHATQDAALRGIAISLDTIQAENNNSLWANIRYCGHYYHSNCMRIEVGTDAMDDDGAFLEVSRETSGIVAELLRDFADWIYSRLETEYNYLMSTEQVDENIRANGYEFLEDGTIA